jgi:hypothetical protein
MGSNTYITAGTIYRGIPNSVPDESTLIFNTRNKELYSQQGYRDRTLKGVIKYCSEDSCRETLLSELNNNFWDNLRPIKDTVDPAILSTVCQGFAYHQVANYLISGRTRTERLEKFIVENFEINLSLVAGRYSVSKSEFPSRGVLRLETYDGHILLRDCYLKLTIRNSELTKEVSTMTYSMILALLREQRICQRIVEGRTKNLQQLANDFFETGYLRFTKADNSYGGFANWLDDDSEEDLEIYPLETIKRKVLDQLSETYNDEGTDYVSSYLMGIYLLEINNPALGEGSGPLDSVNYLFNTHEITESTRKILSKLDEKFTQEVSGSIDDLLSTLNDEDYDD